MEEELSSEKDYQRKAVLVGNELLTGRFTFGQKLGVYVYGPTNFKDPVYQRYGSNYHITNTLFADIHLKTHRHVTDLTEARLGWSFFRAYN